MQNKEKILIDCTFFDGSWTAVESTVVYAGRLLQGLLKYSSYQIYVLIWKGTESLIDNIVGQEVDKIVLDKKYPQAYKRHLYRISGFLPRILKKEIHKRGITIVLHPHCFDVFFHFRKPIKYFAVLHDLFLYDIRKDKFLYYPWRLYRKIMIKRIPHLISISQSTHDELLRRDGKESMVIYNSIAFDFNIAEQQIEAIVGKKYILDVNRFLRYKNAETLIRAFYILKDDIPHLLYLKGDQNNEEDRKGLETLVEELKIKDRVIFDLSYRTEGEMRYLYTHADLFVSPSLKEGFGWTPIEAVIMKTPTIVSDISVFKEVTCGKIPMFNPYSPDNLAIHMKDMLTNPPSEKAKTSLASFFMNRYSLETQISHLISCIASEEE